MARSVDGVQAELASLGWTVDDGLCASLASELVQDELVVGALFGLNSHDGYDAAMELLVATKKRAVVVRRYTKGYDNKGRISSNYIYWSVRHRSRRRAR